MTTLAPAPLAFKFPLAGCLTGKPEVTLRGSARYILSEAAAMVPSQLDLELSRLPVTVTWASTLQASS